MKSAQPTAKDLLECWQDAPLVNRFRRMHSKTKRKIRINTIYYMNSDDWSRLFIPTSLRWKTWLKSFKEKPVLSDFENLLKNEGYHVWVNPVYCPDYGIPQTRKRLVLLASRLGNIELINPTHKPNEYKTVKETIGDLPELKAGETDKNDPLHRAKALSPLNLERLHHTPYGGSWKDWPKDLQLRCHKTDNGRSFGSVYGRMVWEKPAPTMTTQCTGLGNGRFGHPIQDRAISIREAALIQTFPMTYKFFADEEYVAITKASRYIGNAVPPRLGEVIAESIICHLTRIVN